MILLSLLSLQLSLLLSYLYHHYKYQYIFGLSSLLLLLLEEATKHCICSAETTLLQIIFMVAQFIWKTNIK